MHPMLNIAVRAARNAGDIIVRQSTRIDELTITSKERNDYVSEVDRQAENEIMAVIRKAFPDHGILAEESGQHGSGDEFLWIVDPLDGTTNFLHGFPQYAVSIALQHKGRLEQAVIYDPMRQELFTASRGGGAQLDNRRIRVSKQTVLEGALLGTGFPYKDQGHLSAYLEMFKALIVDSAGIRRPGSAALDLAYVAAGRFDGFWEIGLNPWDMAAGVLLVREAGGLVGDLAGGHDFMKNGNIVAAAPKLFPAMLREIRPHLTPELQA
ncbi:MAG: inositol-1-monophosphatase [Thiogranum sp.]|jgi:myo-inositol-1(or 4)-monophosphatase|nr:inositol-1-monophosphatase [Thiogranum sp.]